MPNYVFECEYGHVNEIHQTYDQFDSEDVSDAVCLECGGELRRVWQPVAFSVGGYNSKNGYDKSEGWADKRVVR